MKFASLNGWRAISVFLVLAFHSQFVCPSDLNHFFATWTDGNLGVRFFFTISGFLITALLLNEEKSRGRIDLKSFYIRRCLRIWPVYISFLLIAFLFGNNQSQGAWIGVLTFTRNFHADANHADLLTTHFWSLAIEEQFYLLWPLIFMLRKVRVGFLVGCIILSIVFRTLGILGLHHYLDGCTFNYLDTLAWGCLAAIYFKRINETLLRHPEALFIACAYMVIIPYLAQIGKGIQAVGFAGLLLHSVTCPDWGPYRALNSKWMDRIGVLSYSIYIWQQAVWYFWAAHEIWFLWVPASIAVAVASYWLIEKPFIGLRSKFRTQINSPPALQSLAA